MKARASLKALSALRKPPKEPVPAFHEEELQLVHSWIQNWKKRAVSSAPKKIEDQIAEAVDKAKINERFHRRHFNVVAQDPNRLSKQKFRQFLAQRYGPVIADKLQSTIEFTKTLTMEEYKQAVFKLMNQRTLLLQIAFDIFDTNGDNKISELDLFKLFFHFNQGAQAEEFHKIFHMDICQMTKTFKKKWDIKYSWILHENEQNELYVQRMLQWRNL